MPRPALRLHARLHARLTMSSTIQSQPAPAPQISPPRSHGRRVIRWPAASLRAYFIALILVATVPMTGLASYLIASEVLTARSQLETGLHRTAASFALTVERELVSSRDALYILSFSDTLQRDDIAGFFGTLTSLPSLRSSWRSAYLADMNGEVLFNTGQPTGKPLGDLPDAAALERVRLTGQHAVTSLVRGPDGQRMTSVLVPVRVKGELRYVLGAWIDPASWQKLMTSVAVNKGGFVSIVDARHDLIARSGADGPLPMPPQLPSEGARAPSGSFKGPTVYDAWHTISSAEWTVGVGVPAAPIDRQHMVAVAMAFAAGLLSLIAGLVLALLVARRVTTPLRDLAAAGSSAGASPTRSSEVRELFILQQALQMSEAQRETARERLEAKAKEFEMLFESSPIGLAIAQDPQCHSILRNPALQALFGPTAEQQRERYKVYHHGQLLGEDEQPLRLAARTGARLRDIELEVVDDDGQARQLIAHAVPLLDATGRPRGAIGAYIDITERKKAEKSLIDAERQLRESQHLVELAQEAGHVGFFDRRFETEAVTWSSGLARLFGFSPDQLEGTWQGWMDRVDPLDRPVVEARVAEATAQQSEQTTFEFRVNHGSAAVQWLSCRAILNFNEAAQPQHMIGVVVDITQQKAIERERAEFVAREQAARVEAENANRAKDEFLAMLGHELRNPLGAIAAASEVLNRVAPDHVAAQSARKIIARQTRHLARLMDDLLDVARVIAGKIMLSPRPLDLADAARRLVGTLEVTGALSRHQVRYDLHEAWVQADSVRLEQIINNLLTNALKYTPDGGTIELAVFPEEGAAVLQIRDSGVGMSPALLARVFDLFVQGDPSIDRRQGGLGIGLTLVKRLTELHGGTVFASSDGPGRGSTFTARLPLIDTNPGQTSVLKAQVQGPRRMVVVEDNDDAREALCAMLELAGHTVDSASDGEAGLQLILRAQPEVALVDIGLPVLHGYEVARRLRDSGYEGLLVAVSGYGQPKDVEQALAAGFDAHLVKPVEPGALLDLVTQQHVATGGRQP